MTKPTIKTERYHLARIGADPTPNSGRGIKKADGIIYLNEYAFISVDTKEYKKGFRVTPDLWAKINTDAHINQSEPAYQLILGEKQETKLMVIGEGLFLELLEYYLEGHTK